MKANYQQRSRQSRVIQCKISQPVTQKMAWVVTRPLGNYNPGRLARLFGNIETPFNLNFNHKHIIFDSRYYLPTGLNHDIGFHCAIPNTLFGPGELFSENRAIRDYQGRNVLSHTPFEDGKLVKAIWNCKNFGNYNLLTNNCQDWVSAVRRNYDNL